MSGKFQIDREIFDNGIWNNVSEFRLFFYILGNAIWKDGGVSVGNVKVNKGQYIRSYRKLREDLMYVENNQIKYYGIATIKRMVDKLVKDGRLEVKETELGTLFTVVNYAIYQGFDSPKKKDLEQHPNSSGTVAEQHPNNKKKVKKVKKDNTKEYIDFVENLLPLFPSKKVKKVRDNKLPKIIEEYGEEKVIACVKRFAKDMEGREQKFIPHESTFWNTLYLDYMIEEEQNINTKNAGLIDYESPLGEREEAW